jgi:hypothetical protein
LTERGGQFLVLLHLYEGAPVRVLHATDTVRINAVRAVWDKYNRMKEEEKKNPPATSMAWYHLEEARANIEMMLAVWDKYNRMKEEEKKNPPATSMAWYHLEEARANIEMMLANKIFTKRQERQHERNEARSIGKPHRSR